MKYPIYIYNTNHPKGYALCRTPDGDTIYRRAYAESLGNFVMLSIKYKNHWHLIGEGDEYIRGTPDIFDIK